MHHEEDDQRGADPDGQAYDVDQRKYFVQPEIPESDDKVIFEHGIGVYESAVFALKKCHFNKYLIIKKLYNLFNF